jgi:hypothetical protein
LRVLSFGLRVLRYSFDLRLSQVFTLYRLPAILPYLYVRMKTESSLSGSGDQKHDELPPVGKSVLVEANGCRCMAFRDQDGKWRDYFYGEELRGRIKVIKPD